MFPMVSVCVVVPPGGTFPNDRVAGATRTGSCPGAGVTPVPNSVMQITAPPLVVSVSVAVTAPVVWGVKPTLIVPVSPELPSVRLKGGNTEKAVLPDPEIVALKIWTGLQPLFLTVIGSDAATPTKLFPKFSVNGTACMDGTNALGPGGCPMYCSRM